MNIVLHIDRIVMDGLPVSRAQLPAVRAAMEGELARLFASTALPHFGGSRSVERVAAPAFTYDPLQRPAQIGRQAARSVHAGLGSRR
jgi:hypothetical protein